MNIKTLFNGVYKNKKILVTGHTGFKGSWLSIWLKEMGAKVIGFSLEEYHNEYLFNKSNLKNKIIDERGDIFDLKRLNQVFNEYNPDIVFHLAAQPLVRLSYTDPLLTFRSNVMGTVNLLECIRTNPITNAAVMVTTDKCYKNKEISKGYTEQDELGGRDPYSASKACAELVIESYQKSFFDHNNKFVSSVRAGNVIGGGDFSPDRIVTECIHSLKLGKPINIRNPHATRPWQHVIEPLYGYLLLGQKLLNKDSKYIGAWNFGPNESSAIEVFQLVEKIIKVYGKGTWSNNHNPNEKLHESKLLCLDSTKARKNLNWYQKWNINQTIDKTIEWYKRSEKEEAYSLCVEQIRSYLKILEEENDT